MARELRADWIRDLIALELLATIALLVAARLQRPQRGESDGGMLRWLGCAIAGFAAAGIVIVGALLVTGATVSGLYDGAIVQGVKIGDVFTIPFTSPAAAVDWGIAAVAAAAIVVLVRSGRTGESPFWPGLLRCLAGFVIWLTVARAAPFSLAPAGNQEALPLVLVWVAAVTPAGNLEPPYRRFLRVALPSLALMETLQVYPVAGSQVGIAAVSFVAVGAICLADGVGLLRAWSEARGGRALEGFALVSAVVILALAGSLALKSIARPATSGAVLYHDQPALPFSGASLIHPSPGQVEEYGQLVAMLKAHRCTMFIGQPNVDSLYLWSGIDPPKPSAPGAWLVVLDDVGQQRIVNQLRSTPRPCAIRNDAAADAWLHGSPLPDTPLVRYISRDFEQTGQVGGWLFLEPKTSS